MPTYRALSRLLASVALLAIIAHTCAAESEALPPAAPANSPEAVEFFETHIRPILVEKCYECHSADSKVLQANLRLDSADRLRAGGDSGPAVVPHKPEESLLLAVLRYESYEMPPSGKLPDEVIQNFERWIAMGAPDPRVESAQANAPTDQQPSASDARQHWAYTKPVRSSPPPVRHEAAVRNDIDRFVLARLEAANLKLSAQAPPRVLLRRLHYDLTGLPPAVAELDEFAADPSDERYQAIVDRLLASPRFGERWARFWLDVARYADTKGYVFQQDRNYPKAYTYRDWVIASFNDDRPYDRFIVAQIAGDQVDDPTCAPASGFLTLGRRFLNNQHDIINDRIDVVTRGLIGLTVACARCHDHKYDAISAADYYAMYGVFASSEETPRDDAPPALKDASTLYDPYVFLRGNAGNRGPKVERRFLSALAPGGEPKPFKNGSGRLEMAEAIASPENPLTARVWVNRVWGHLLGAPIVDTPSDFGVRGTPPTHPELLDWLACDLMENKWSTKRLVRQIVLSGTYRQSSESRADGIALDADNHLLWRANRRRLDLEQMRDTHLVAAGRLDETMGGPSVSITDPPFSTRRAIYGFIERQNLPAFFRTFDFSNPGTHTPERPLTTSPQQALFFMNSPYVMEQAIKLAERSAQNSTAATNSASAAERVQRINRLYQFAIGRDAQAEEIAEAIEFVDRGEPASSDERRRQLAWQFGWGVLDENGKGQFTALPHFTGGAWQGGPAWPDPNLGYVMLNEEGGHPGDAVHQVIRRWTAPAAGTIQVEGVLSHDHELGDGVRGRVISSRAGVHGQWIAFRNQSATAPPAIPVEAGDTIDFVVDSQAGIDNDTFSWPVTIRLSAAGGQGEQVWDSLTEFHGPLVPPLDRWEQLAQVLLMSNEFMFVD